MVSGKDPIQNPKIPVPAHTEHCQLPTATDSVAVAVAVERGPPESVEKVNLSGTASIPAGLVRRLPDGNNISISNELQNNHPDTNTTLIPSLYSSNPSNQHHCLCVFPVFHGHHHLVSEFFDPVLQPVQVIRAQHTHQPVQRPFEPINPVVQVR